MNRLKASVTVSEQTQSSKKSLRLSVHFESPTIFPVPVCVSASKTLTALTAPFDKMTNDSAGIALNLLIASTKITTSLNKIVQAAERL